MFYSVLIKLFVIISVFNLCEAQTFSGISTAEIASIELYAGIWSEWLVVNLVNPPDPVTNVRLTPTDTSDDLPGGQVLEFEANMQFSETFKQNVWRIKATSAGVQGKITWTVSNNDYLTPLETLVNPIEIPMLIAQPPTSMFSGIESPPISLYTEFTPASTIDFTPSLQPTLNIQPAGVFSMNGGDRIIDYRVTGGTSAVGNPTTITYSQQGGVALYDAAAISTPISIQLRTFNTIEYPSVLLIGQEYFFSISTELPPGTSGDTLRITPRGAGLSFKNIDDGQPIATFEGEQNTVRMTVTPTFFGNSGSRNIYYSEGGSKITDYAPLSDSNVIVKKRNFDFSTIPTEVFVGEEFYISFTTHPKPVTSVTLNLIGNGLLFNDETEFSGTITPTSTAVSFKVTVDPTLLQPDQDSATTFINFIVTGTDARQYQKPADISILVKKRGLFGSSLPSSITLGAESHPIHITLPQPPEDNFIVTPRCPQGTVKFSPENLIFDSTTTVLSFTITPLLDQYPTVDIIYEIGGLDVNYYTPPPSAQIQINRKKFTFLNLPSNLDIGETSGSVWVTIDQPTKSEITLTPSSNGLIFNPPTLSFNQFITAASFTIEVSSLLPLSRTIEWNLDGNDSSHVGFPETTTINIAQKSAVSGKVGPIEISQTSGPISVTLSNPPSEDGYILTPRSIGLSFTPESLTFNKGQQTNYFQVTGDSLQNAEIEWSSNGVDPFITSPLLDFPTVTKRSISLENFPTSLINGIGSAPITLRLNVAPTNGGSLVISPYGSSLTVSPSEITFQPGQTVKFFTVTFNDDTVSNLESSGNSFTRLVFNHSGDEHQFYDHLPTVNDILIKGRTLDIKYPTLFSGTESYPVLVDLDFAPENGFSLTPRSSSLSFNPSSVVFAPGQKSGVFRVTGNLDGTQGSLPVTYSLSGTDANKYNVPSIQNVPVSQRQFLIDQRFSQNLENLFLKAGVASEAFTISLTGPSSSTVTLIPSSPILTFNPPSFDFTANVPSISFTVTPTQISDQVNVYFRIEGPNTDLFQIPPPMLNPFRITHNFIFSEFGHQLVGEESSDITLSLGGAYSFDSVALKLKGPGLKFSPSVFEFTDSARSAVFTVTGYTSGFSSLNVQNFGVKKEVTMPFSIWVKELSEDKFYEYTNEGETEVDILPHPVLVEYPSELDLDNGVTAKFSLFNLPANGLTITPYGNNMKFEPSTIVFGENFEVEVQVTALYDTSANTHVTPYYVDYELGGSDSESFLTPARTVHWLGIPTTVPSTIPTTSNPTVITETITESITESTIVSETVSVTTIGTVSETQATITVQTVSNSNGDTATQTATQSSVVIETQTQSQTASITATDIITDEITASRTESISNTNEGVGNTSDDDKGDSGLGPGWILLIILAIILLLILIVLAVLVRLGKIGNLYTKLDPGAELDDYGDGYVLYET